MTILLVRISCTIACMQKCAFPLCLLRFRTRMLYSCRDQYPFCTRFVPGPGMCHIAVKEDDVSRPERHPAHRPSPALSQTVD